MKKTLYLLSITSILFTSCKKKFDIPPPKTSPAISGYITIDSIIKRYNAYYLMSPDKVYKFNSDVNLVGVITADEISGNLYKSVYIKDATSGIKLNLTYSGGLYVGDSVRINLNGIKLNSYGSQIQLDSIDLERSVHKIATGLLVKPRKATFNQLATFNPSLGQLYYQSELVVLDSIEFDNGAKNVTFADAVGKGSISHLVVNSFGKKVILRTSGYSNFAASVVPCGKGKIIAIVGQYNGAIQLTLRQYTDVSVSSGTCPVYCKSFNDNSITNGGWTMQNVTGTINWVTSTSGGAPNYYASISNYPTNQTCETWLISPAFDLTNNINPYLNFENAKNFSGGSLTALISNNYVNGNPNAATWSSLTYSVSPGGYAFVNSGNISLSAYKTSNVHLAFKYSASGSATTWELDNIAILDF